MHLKRKMVKWKHPNHHKPRTRGAFSWICSLNCYHYYNTLGFEAELIDYIDHVDDSIVYYITV